jgi:GR25 family glycosyltransferase involved in LPS biosynthesis
MKIFITHYTKLVERKKHILQQFENQKITDYYFIENLNAEELTNEQINIFDIHNPVMGNQIYRKNLISLFLKHIYIYNLIIKNNEDYVLIFEDDIILDNNFMEKLNNYIEDLPKDFDALFIGNGCNLHIPNNKIKDGKHIYEECSTRCCDSYLISKKCAIKIIDFYNYFIINNIKIDKPIDHWLNLAFKKTNCNIYWSEPAIASQGSENNIFKSSLR